MKKLIYLLIVFSQFGCRYFNTSPVDGVLIKHVKEEPSLDDVIGEWEVDNISYNLVKNNGYEEAEIRLVFNKDGTFEAFNYPSFMNVFKKIEERKLYNLKGKWNLIEDQKNENWKLNIVFDSNDLYERVYSDTYDLFLKKGKLIIWFFIGDPDSGEYFLFEKK